MTTRLSWALLASLLGGVDLPSVAEAEPPSTGSPRARTTIGQIAQDTVRKRAFAIPAQPLADALEVFRRQSGLEVTVPANVPAGLRSSPVSGMLPPVDALSVLLAGTGLTGRLLDEQTIVLSQGTSGVQVLEPIQVVAKAGRRSRYAPAQTSTATKTATPLRDVPQSVSVVTDELIADQAMRGMADVVRYMPGVTMGQGEGNRDQPTIRGNGSTAGFFVDGFRDDVQYFRDLYNVDRVEGLKGANALIFGRGVGGGVINRVSKEAEWAPTREVTLTGGSYGSRRGAIDVGQGISGQLAARVNAMYENSDVFRHEVSLERYGLNPTVTFAPGARTRVIASYERFSDHRTADRGVPSFQGRPADADVRTFFGDPGVSHADADVNVGVATVEHGLSPSVIVRNRTLLGHYDKFYQNVFPAAVNADETEVALNGYNQGIERLNLFNQIELTYRLVSGSIRQTLLGGFEVGRQVSDNFRNTGYFDGTATAVSVPFSAPTVSRPITFRQSATDADNHTANTTLSLYAQSQLELSPAVQLIGGARYERFDLTFHNNRTGNDLARTDNLISPRAGLVVKPVAPLSLYASYSVSYLPSSGEQFTSLTATTATLEPEKFTNYEAGLKWDVFQSLAVTAAVYQLDRTNTTASDPADPSRTVQTGSQRTKGFELGATGNVTAAWQIAGGYANQDAYITSRTSAAAPGARVPLVPRNTVSLWNRYQIAPRFGLGAGVIYQDRMFAAIDDAVTLPSFTRVDAAAYVTLTRNLRAQLNVENVFDRRYFITSHSNNNISPGSPRALRVSLTAGL